MKQERQNDDAGLDARLDAVLRALPDKPVASNFTACVLQGLEREHAAHPVRWRFRPVLGWLPRLAFATLALTTALVTYQVRARAEHEQFARSLAAVSQVASLPSPDALKDFDAIRRLSQTPPADTELLALLQ
jgi:hypothetical protein